jgi:chromate transporter
VSQGVTATQPEYVAKHEEATERVSLLRLFLIFLRIGCTTWGGFMTFIAVVSKSLSTRNIATEEDITDAIMVAQMLPGPVAVDMTVAIGYRLRGLAGAAVCWFGSVTPSFIVVTTLSVLYLHYGKLPAVTRVFQGFPSAMVAIVAVAAYEMSKKQVKNSQQLTICIVAALVILTQSLPRLPGESLGFYHIIAGAWWITLAVIVVAGFTGWMLYREKAGAPPSTPVQPRRAKLSVFVPFLAAALPATGASLVLKILLTFAGMSVVLFGSGYVFIPIIKSTLVHNLHWLTADEFTAGLALTQITPGPILMTAAFVGVKLAGLPGAIAGMLGMFVPPAILTLIVAHALQLVKKSKGVTAALKGIRPAVVGMIFAAAVVVGESMPHDSVWHVIASAVILAAAFFAILRMRVEVALIIPLAGIAGFFLFLR